MFCLTLAKTQFCFTVVCIIVCVSAQKIHASSETYLALIKDNAYELQLRGEIEVKVKDPSQSKVKYIFCVVVRQSHLHHHIEEAIYM